MIQHIKQKLQYIPFDIFIAILIVLIGFCAFALGWTARGEQQSHPVQVEKIPFSNAETAGLFVGSINSDKYHYRWCAGGERISAENKVFFDTKEAAHAAGYQPASNCPGM
jgi:hypothetical protein